MFSTNVAVDLMQCLVWVIGAITCGQLPGVADSLEVTLVSNWHRGALGSQCPSLWAETTRPPVAAVLAVMWGSEVSLSWCLHRTRGSSAGCACACPSSRPQALSLWGARWGSTRKPRGCTNCRSCFDEKDKQNRCFLF